jgi:hypothetical protein
MVYLYDACDQISDFCRQVTEKNATKNILDEWKDRRKTVYPPRPVKIATVQSIPVAVGPHFYTWFPATSQYDFRSMSLSKKR